MSRRKIKMSIEIKEIKKGSVKKKDRVWKEKLQFILE